MLIIILSLTGIVSVISIWLYGSYKHRLEGSVMEVDRSLFNAVQSYYEIHQDSLKNSSKHSTRSFDSFGFIQALRDTYNNIDSVQVQNIIDSLVVSKMNRLNPIKESANSSRAYKPIIPPFLLQRIEFDKVALSSLDTLLTKNLKEKGMSIDVEIVLEKVEAKNMRYRSKIHLDDLGFIATRPVLVNPQYNEYLIARFEPPIAYVIGKMFWQLVIGILLILGLISTFIYLFWTINRQNKMAQVRKAFVNNMTHELKTPVAIVMAAIEAIQRFGAKDDKVKRDKYLQISQRELSHLSHMIESVLQLDMDDMKGIVIEKSSFDVIDLIRDVIELNQLGATKSVTMDLISKEGCLMVNWDYSHLKNVLNNLVDNAIKYSNDSAEVVIAVSKVDDEYVKISIKDHGIGIDASYLNNIFEMFFRVPSGNLHPVKGFGLGLAYVKLVVEKHRGNVSVKSVVGQGTEFSIKLPL